MRSTTPFCEWPHPFITRIANALGPCAPSSRVCSISPVRDGPVTKLMVCAECPFCRSRISTSSSRGRMFSAITTAISRPGRKCHETGESGADGKTRVPVSAIANGAMATAASFGPGAVSCTAMFQGSDLISVLGGTWTDAAMLCARRRSATAVGTSAKLSKTRISAASAVTRSEKRCSRSAARGGTRYRGGRARAPVRRIRMVERISSRALICSATVPEKSGPAVQENRAPRTSHCEVEVSGQCHCGRQDVLRIVRQDATRDGKAPAFWLRRPTGLKRRLEFLAPDLWNIPALASSA